MNVIKNLQFPNFIYHFAFLLFANTYSTALMVRWPFEFSFKNTIIRSRTDQIQIQFTLFQEIDEYVFQILVNATVEPEKQVHKESNLFAFTLNQSLLFMIDECWRAIRLNK